MVPKTPKTPPEKTWPVSRGQLVDVIIRTKTGSDFYPGGIQAIGATVKRGRLCIVVDPEIDPDNPPKLDLNSHIELISQLR